MRENYLVEPIKILLETAGQPLSEYQVMQYLMDAGWLVESESNNTLSLYSAHFLIFNALFQLAAEYQQSSQSVFISALAIVLQDASDVLPTAAVMPATESTDNQAVNQSLQDYYLDWRHLDQATKQSVDSLLNHFWESYVGSDDLAKALSILDLTHRDSLSEVKQRYRQLAMQHHPDRGGNAVLFQEVQWAFSILQRQQK